MLTLYQANLEHQENYYLKTTTYFSYTTYCWSAVSTNKQTVISPPFKFLISSSLLTINMIFNIEDINQTQMSNEIIKGKSGRRGQLYT